MGLSLAHRVATGSLRADGARLIRPETRPHFCTPLDGMDRILLTDIENRVLPMAEDDVIHSRIAGPVLGAFYGRHAGFRQLSSSGGRLSARRLIRRCIRLRGPCP